MSCIFSQLKNGYISLLPNLPSAWTYFILTSKYLLSFSLTARHPQLYSITYILFHIKIRHYMKGKERDSPFQSIWQASLAGCQASAKSSSLSWACSLETNRMLLWQHCRQPASKYEQPFCFQCDKTTYYRGSERETIFDPL